MRLGAARPQTSRSPYLQCQAGMHCSVSVRKRRARMPPPLLLLLYCMLLYCISLSVAPPLRLPSLAEADRVCVTDLNSTNGTVVNGQELGPLDNAEVAIGGEVIFGACDVPPLLLLVLFLLPLMLLQVLHQSNQLLHVCAAQAMSFWRVTVWTNCQIRPLTAMLCHHRVAEAATR
jgi:FHA domain